MSGGTRYEFRRTTGGQTRMANDSIGWLDYRNDSRKDNTVIIKLMNYYGGQFRNGAELLNAVDPATEEIYAHFPRGIERDINEAVAGARETQKEWYTLGRVERGEILAKIGRGIQRCLDEVAKTITLETGKNINESIAEVNEAIHMFEIAAATAKTPFGEVVASEGKNKEIHITRKPRGVVGIISPWNFPFAIGGAWNLAPALLEGNTVVWKPSEHTPLCAYKILKICLEAGLPSGVLNIVYGDGYTGAALSKSDVDVILFTGSVDTSKKIRHACADSENGKFVVCETGSKSGIIVRADAHMDIAIDACVPSAFKLTGQRCVSCSRIFVQRTRYDQFIEGFYQRVRGLKAGRDYGPLISAEQVKKVFAYNNMVRDDKECIILNGLDYVTYPDKGFWLCPLTYRTNWDNTKPFLVEEVFGPHVAIIPFDRDDEVIGYYNDTPYGLSAGLITEDYKAIRKFRDGLDVGMLYVNSGCIGGESHVPFGGVKCSGNGWKVASHTYEAVTSRIATTINYGDEVVFAQGMDK